MPPASRAGNATCSATSRNAVGRRSGYSTFRRIATLRERISLRNAQGKDASEADLRVLQQQIETARTLNTDELPVTTVYKDGCTLNSDQ